MFVKSVRKSQISLVFRNPIFNNFSILLRVEKSTSKVSHWRNEKQVLRYFSVLVSKNFLVSVTKLHLIKRALLCISHEDSHFVVIKSITFPSVSALTIWTNLILGTRHEVLTVAVLSKVSKVRQTGNFQSQSRNRGRACNWARNRAQCKHCITRCWCNDNCVAWHVESPWCL